MPQFLRRGGAQPIPGTPDAADARDDAGAELVRTPSLQRDIESGMDEARAIEGQAARQGLRVLNAELAELRHELRRRDLLRGPSGVRRVCDEHCLLGGCEGEFAEEEGVLCSDCGLFLCLRCFGELNVSNECQVGGRYDKAIEAPGGSTSPPGSLPCPNFGAHGSCSVAHIPLADIQRAMLHPDNRGAAGDHEDVNSAGHSPHKLHLLARLRVAEEQLSSADDSPRGRELVRTFTEAVIGAPSSSDVAVQLADKQSEKAELEKALELRPVHDAISREKQRVCAQCAGVFHADFEGVSCSILKPQHFLCNVCFGEYLLRVCVEGGTYEGELSSADGQCTSAAGSVPCPLFSGHADDGLASFRVARDCDCHDIGTTAIEQALLDPRNRSPEYYRERRGEAIILSRATLDWSLEAEWSRESDILARGDCPLGVYEAARLRVAKAEEAAAAERRAAKEEQGLLAEAEAGGASAAAVARAKHRMEDALDRGGSLRCPKCGVRVLKDDACIHIDSCACGSKWCFLCNKESGDGPGECPRGPGKGGCDEHALFLERHDGWDNFAIGDENEAAGAQKEFLRRRMAFLLREVKNDTPPEVWAQLRGKHADLLEGVPTPGRRIDWDEIDTAELPLFGANRDAGDAQERMREQWQAMLEQEQGLEQRNRQRLGFELRKAVLPSLVLALFAALFIDAVLVSKFSSGLSPDESRNATEVCADEQQLSSLVTFVESECCDGGECCDEQSDSSCVSRRACLEHTMCPFCTGITVASIDRLIECNATNATASNQSLTKAATDCWDLPAAGTAGLWSDGNVGCDGYVDNDWCEQFGAMDFAGFGTANAHCCACGGGT